MTPWWGRVALVYVAARVVTTIVVLAFAAAQGPNAWTAGHPDYWAFANLWDARWYEIIGFGGYPRELPLDDQGFVAENQWAFMPVYPVLVSVVMLTGLPWNIAAVLVSGAAGLGAALVLFRLFRRFLDADQALFGVVLFSFAPTSPLLQFGYAESLSYLLLATALLLLVDRRYGWLFPVVLVWSFTRPGAVAFAATLLVHLVVRWVRRRAEPFPPRQIAAVVGLGLFTFAAGFAWLAVAGLVTGHPTAYLDTEFAWRAAYVGRVDAIPFTGWFLGGDWWLGQPWGTLAPIALVLVLALLLVSPWVRRLGPDIRAWIGSYGLYLFAVFFPQSSTFRMLGPMFPILGALAVPRWYWFRWGLVAVCIAGQVGWLWICWWIMGADWTPP
ncbi:hypothetical protein GB864_13425 [Agromyces sp. MMS17-SY077]|uniref:Integral membrane protein n=1 Tax=Agromyces seonyuensis TaxID=2662446 RepID=A0A6I4P3U2_9MICO|nr:hypothetical protein [Agromyces seonyuensis]MWB99545.1 hypothetical protein [Agromyces seonyuensis]